MFGDVAYTGYLEKERGSSDIMVARQTAETAVFQVAASLALPAVIIHTVVDKSSNILAKMKPPPLIARLAPYVSILYFFR